VAEVGVLADEFHLHGLAEWAGQMWEAVMRDDAQGARSMGRTFRHTIVAQATEELAAAAGRRGRRETAVRPADPAGPPAAATTTLYARVIVTLSFVAALGAVALVLAYIVGRYSMVVFGQLFR
jgi:hypothetical protein